MIVADAGRDGLLVASAEAAGCACLPSEDLQSGRKFGALTVVNPSPENPASLAWRLSRDMLVGVGGSVRHHSQDSRLRELLKRIKQLLKREPDLPEDPYAYVGAPKKPRPPLRSSSAAVEPER